MQTGIAWLQDASVHTKSGRAKLAGQMNSIWLYSKARRCLKAVRKEGLHLAYALGVEISVE